MNENKIDCQGLIQQGLGLNGDFINSEFGKRSHGQYLDATIREVWNVGICNQPPQQHIGPATIMSRFESPASAFYAAELCMGFAEYDCQGGNNNNNHSLSPQVSNEMNNDLEFPLYQRENIFLLDSDNQHEMSNTLQAMVKSQILDSNQCCRSMSLQKSSKTPCGNFPLPTEKQKIFNDGAAGNQDHRVACGSYNLPFAQLNFSSHHDDKSQALSSSASVSATSGNPASNGGIVSSKTRIRWTQNLHEKFVACVNLLGGADKATPKAILKMMDSDGLTIFHVKSHLQKYRIAKFMPESTQGKSDRRIHLENVQQPLDVKTGFQLKEALRLQLDAQRHLHEQLEIQRKLQLRIEEQGRQLKRMFDQQQKTTISLLNCQNTANEDPSISLEGVD